MKNKTLIVGLIGLVFLVILILAVPLFLSKSGLLTNSSLISTNSSTTFDKTITDKVFSLKYPSVDFGVATFGQSIPLQSYIPACESDFDYCLYFTGLEYKGTNLESAGLRVKNRTDLNTEKLCLETPAAGQGRETPPVGTVSKDIYSAALFAPTGDAGAGHYASGLAYRFFYRQNSSCYELETRIGRTQFMNYPAGTIKEFTTTDLMVLQNKIKEIIISFSLPGLKEVVLP